MERARRYLTSLAVLSLLLLSSALLPAQQVAAADYWSIAMVADAGLDGSNEFLELGTKSSATGGFDAGGIDVPNPPPGPGVNSSAYFRITDPIFSRLNADYRDVLASGPDSSIVWTLELSSATQPTTLSWSSPDSAGVPTGASLTLSGSGRTIDMRASSSTTFPAGTHTLTITASRSGAPTTTPTTTPTTPPPPSTEPDDDDASDDEDGQPDTEGTNETDDTDNTAGAGSHAPSSNDAFSCTALSIKPAQALPGQEITISATVCNTGGESTTASVSLMVNGEATSTQSISLSSAACEQVVFVTYRDAPGLYQVAVSGMTGQFSVVAPGDTAGTTVPAPRQAGLDTTGIVVLSAVLIVIIVGLIMVFRRD